MIKDASIKKTVVIWKFYHYGVVFPKNRKNCF